MGHNNIIELNGKQYDALTGALLSESLVQATPASQAKYAKAHRGRSVDGFIPGARQSESQLAAKTHTASDTRQKQPAAKAPTARHFDIQRPKPKATTAHQPQRARTLMRHVVSKPKANLKPAIKTASPAEIMAKPAAAIALPLEKKISVTQVNPIRLSHAKHVAKSHHIQHFNNEAALPTAPAKTHHNSSAQKKQHLHYELPIAQRVVLKEEPQSATNLFESALAQATSHEEPIHKKQGRRSVRHRKLVSGLAGVAAFLIIGGFVTYLNLPAIELNVASMHAGFHAAAPTYKPTGYALANGVKASKGKIEMTYRSGDSSYKITQVVSDWNSTTLLDQNLEQRGAPTRTIQSQGRTIYIYDNNATWVNGGILYGINGNASLGTSDLVSLATSM